MMTITVMLRSDCVRCGGDGFLTINGKKEDFCDICSGEGGAISFPELYRLTMGEHIEMEIESSIFRELATRRDFSLNRRNLPKAAKGLSKLATLRKHVTLQFLKDLGVENAAIIMEDPDNVRKTDEFIGALSG